MLTNRVSTLIGRVEASDRKGTSDIAAKASDLLPLLSQIVRESEEIRLNAKLAEFEDGDPEIRARMGLYQGSCGAIIRHANNIEAEVTELIRTFRQLEHLHAEVRDLIESKAMSPEVVGERSLRDE